MIRLLLLVALVLTLAGGAAATPKPSPSADCTWGASSTIVENGVQSTPVTTGCIP